MLNRIVITEVAGNQDNPASAYDVYINDEYIQTHTTKHKKVSLIMATIATELARKGNDALEN